MGFRYHSRKIIIYYVRCQQGYLVVEKRNFQDIKTYKIVRNLDQLNRKIILKTSTRAIIFKKPSREKAKHELLLWRKCVRK